MKILFISSLLVFSSFSFSAEVCSIRFYPDADLTFDLINCTSSWKPMKKRYDLVTLTKELADQGYEFKQAESLNGQDWNTVLYVKP